MEANADGSGWLAAGVLLVPETSDRRRLRPAPADSASKRNRSARMAENGLTKEQKPHSPRGRIKLGSRVSDEGKAISQDRIKS
jgi:hypothetical protein